MHLNPEAEKPMRFPGVGHLAPLALVSAAVLVLSGGDLRAEMRPTKPQAAAAVALYKQALGQCGGEGPACEATAQRQFVEAMNCVVHGKRGVNPSTVEEDFTGYVELISAALDGPEGAAGSDLGPCFATAAVAPASEGPTLEALQKFRQQAEELNRPAPPPPPAPEEPSAFDKLKADLEKMRKRARSPGTTTVTPPGLVPRGVPLPPAATPTPSPLPATPGKP